MDVRCIQSIFEETAYVRFSGTPEEHKCAAYLQERCAELGLQARLEAFAVDKGEIQQAELWCDGEAIPCTGYLFAAAGTVEAPLYYLNNTDPWSMSQCKGKIVLSDSRHPVVEALLDVPFVPNDVLLDSGDNRVAIITGPNMAGKSTYMRQTALIVLMAQIGCFVPASSAEIGVVDGIYTRVGASDDLASGQSTFMVEMNEVAEILENATSSSLIIFDEIGRGTSTYDGMSIARAVLEYVADKKKLGAKTLFATHYHELTVLETTLKCVKNYNIAAKKSGDDITFLRRIIRGGADESYGIEVAKLAGVPETVVRRAKQILKQLEEGKVTEKKKVESVEQTMFDFSSPGEEEALLLIRNADVNNMSPIEALGLLDRLCRLVK